MASYSIEFKTSVTKDLRGIPRQDVAKLLDVIKRLATNPHPQGSRKLAGREAWRLRAGQYRIIYTIKDKDVTVVIIKIGHRKNVYR